MNRKFNIVLEVVWALTGILCLYAGTRYAFSGGGSRSFIFLILAVVSFLFAWHRDRERKK